MTDTRRAKKSLLGLPLPPPPLDGEGASEDLADEGFAARAERDKDFVEYVVPHSPLLLAYACSRLESQEEAENAVQDVMDNAWKVDVVRKCRRNAGRTQAYLLKSIRNRVANAFRERDRDRELKTALKAFHSSRTNDAVPPWQYAEWCELVDAMDRALQELSWIHREAFRLVRILDIEFEVAADSLEMNVNTLRACVTKATRHLRERLAPYYARYADGGREKEDTP